MRLQLLVTTFNVVSTDFTQLVAVKAGQAKDLVSYMVLYRINAIILILNLKENFLNFKENILRFIILYYYKINIKTLY